MFDLRSVNDVLAMVTGRGDAVVMLVAGCGWGVEADHFE